MPASSSAASRRMESASKPSSSAIFTAAAAISSRLKRGLRLPGSGRVQTSKAASWALSSSSRARLAGQLGLGRLDLGRHLVGDRLDLAGDLLRGRVGCGVPRASPLPFVQCTGNVRRTMYDTAVRHTTSEGRRAGSPPLAGVHAEGLGKRYGDLWAVRDLDLDVEPGTVLGLLGHNGAGKTTAIRMLTTLSRADRGPGDGRRLRRRRPTRRGAPAHRRGLPAGHRRPAAGRPPQPRADRPPQPAPQARPPGCGPTSCSSGSG